MVFLGHFENVLLGLSADGVKLLIRAHLDACLLLRVSLRFSLNNGQKVESLRAKRCCHAHVNSLSLLPKDRLCYVRPDVKELTFLLNLTRSAGYEDQIAVIVLAHEQLNR